MGPRVRFSPCIFLIRAGSSLLCALNELVYPLTTLNLVESSSGPPKMKSSISIAGGLICQSWAGDLTALSSPTSESKSAFPSLLAKGPSASLYFLRLSNTFYMSTLRPALFISAGNFSGTKLRAFSNCYYFFCSSVIQIGSLRSVFLNYLQRLMVLLPGRECISVESAAEVAAKCVRTIIFY